MQVHMAARNGEEQGAWPQIEATTLSDRVYQVIRNRILQREIKPGTFIREQEISGATGVSRTPVREALNRLASQDFLERVPHRGFRVPDNPWEMLLEVYPIVTALEVLAGSLALERFTDEDVAQLKELNRNLEEAGQRGDAKAQVQWNNAFHEVLSRKSGNQRLAELLDQLRSQVALVDVWYYSVPEHGVESVQDHARIIEAIERKDAESALSWLERNYIRGRQSLEEELARADTAADALG